MMHDVLTVDGFERVADAVRSLLDEQSRLPDKFAEVSVETLSESSQWGRTVIARGHEVTLNQRPMFGYRVTPDSLLEIITRDAQAGANSLINYLRFIVRPFASLLVSATPGIVPSAKPDSLRSSYFTYRGVIVRLFVCEELEHGNTVLVLDALLGIVPRDAASAPAA